MKFLLTTEGEGTEAFETRPTQAEIKERGEGAYLLLRPDGSLIKRFTVSRNRKGGLNLVATTPDGLEGVTTLHLQRLAKAYITVVKYWPAKTGDAKRITAETDRRQTLVNSTNMFSWCGVGNTEVLTAAPNLPAKAATKRRIPKAKVSA